MYIINKLGILRNEDEISNDDSSEKSNKIIWFTLYFFVQVIRNLFLSLKLCK